MKITAGRIYTLAHPHVLSCETADEFWSQGGRITYKMIVMHNKTFDLIIVIKHYQTWNENSNGYRESNYRGFLQLYNVYENISLIPDTNVNVPGGCFIKLDGSAPFSGFQSQPAL